MRADQHHLLTAGMSIEIKSQAMVTGTYLGTYQWNRVAEVIWEPASPLPGVREAGNPVTLYWAHLQLDRPLRRVPIKRGKVQPEATTPHTAEQLPYDNTSSGLTADDVQDAIDEIAADVADAGSDVTPSELETHHRFIIISHHGDTNATDGYPQDSLEANRLAAIRGVDRFDLDCRQSLDGTWWVFHDDNLGGVTNGSGNVNTKTDAQLATYYYDSGAQGYNATRHGTSIGIATLDDMIEQLSVFDPVYLLDHKTGTDAGAGALAQYVVDNGLIERARIITYSGGQTAAVDAVRTGLLANIWIGPSWSSVTASYVQSQAPVQVFGKVDFGESTSENDIVRQLWERGARGITSIDIPTAVQARAELEGLDYHTDESDPHSEYILDTNLGPTGGMVYASSANIPAPLAIGSEGEVLTVRSGVPAWDRSQGGRILLADGHSTPFAFNDQLQMDDGSDFMWSDT
jgi:hypothetical protein